MTINDVGADEADQAAGLRNLISMRRSERPLRVIATTSGKGGVGKTTVACNLAALAARQGHKVLMVDADLGLANVEIVLGVKPRYTLADVLEKDMAMNDVLSRGPEGIRILSAGNGLQHLTQLTEQQKMRLIAAFDPLADAFDTMIVDTGSGIGDNVLFFASAAQEVLLVISAEPTSLTDAYATVKVLSQQAGVRSFHVLVNPAANEVAARDVFQKLTGVTRRFLSASVSYLGFVPYDEHVHRAVMAQRPLVDVFPSAPASRALEHIFRRLFDRALPPTVDGGLKFMWQRVLRDANPPAAGL